MTFGPRWSCPATSLCQQPCRNPQGQSSSALTARRAQYYAKGLPLWTQSKSWRTDLIHQDVSPRLMADTNRRRFAQVEAKQQHARPKVRKCSRKRTGSRPGGTRHAQVPVKPALQGSKMMHAQPGSLRLHARWRTPTVPGVLKQFGRAL